MTANAVWRGAAVGVVVGSGAAGGGTGARGVGLAPIRAMGRAAP